MTTTYNRRYREILERLKSARGESGLTQAQVAGRLNTYASYVFKCESGERRIDILELEQFAELYKKPILWFLQKPQMPKQVLKQARKRVLKLTPKRTPKRALKRMPKRVSKRSRK